MYEYCDLKWGSITAFGFLSLLIGIAALSFPREAIGFIVIFTAIIILVLAGILIAEGLFMEGAGVLKWVIGGIGVLGVLIALSAFMYPAWVVFTAGTLIGACLIIFGGLMMVAAATIIFDFIIRSIVAFSAFVAILIGVYFIFVPTTSLEIFTLAVGTFLILFGIVRIIYGVSLRSWQKTCPSAYLEQR
jgi:uncharacterized membrane protein HdeD (DUF308 family)